MRVLVLLLLALLPFSLWGKEAVPTNVDPVHEKRAVELSEKLRCLVCQNQSISESNAELAADLRRQIREQIKQGKSDQQIIDFMVQRYGDFVLYKPPVKMSTLLLWFGPALLLVIGISIFLRSLHKRRIRAEDKQLSEEERKQAELLLTGGGDRQT